MELKERIEKDGQRAGERTEGTEECGPKPILARLVRHAEDRDHRTKENAKTNPA